MFIDGNSHFLVPRTEMKCNITKAPGVVSGVTFRLDLHVNPNRFGTYAHTQM